MKIEVDETNDSWMTTTRKNNEKARTKKSEKKPTEGKEEKKARALMASRIVDDWFLRRAVTLEGRVYGPQILVVDGPSVEEFILLEEKEKSFRMRRKDSNRAAWFPKSGFDVLPQNSRADDLGVSLKIRSWFRRRMDDWQQRVLWFD